MLPTNDAAAMLLSQTWQLAALSLGVLLAVRFFARDRPHLAHALWIVVLLKCLTPPLWTSPTGVFCWLRPTIDGIGTVGNSPQVNTATIRAWTAGATKLSDEDIRRLNKSTAVDRTVMQPIPQPEDSQAAAWQKACAWLVWVWLTGAGLTLAISLGRLAVFLLTLRKSRLRADSQLTETVDRLCMTLQVGRRVRLRITDSRIGPAVIGLFRPLILLPEAIVSGKRPADLEPILAHELIHVRRGDLWLGLWQLLARSVWWFHPLVWLALARLVGEAERCCDEEVVAGLRCEPARYARGLLDVLERKRWLRPAPAFPGVRPVDVTSKRLERIMNLGQGCRKRTPWYYWLALAAIAVITLPGGTRLAAQANADDPVANPLAPSVAPQSSAAAKVEAKQLALKGIGALHMSGSPMHFQLVFDKNTPPWKFSGNEYELIDLPPGTTTFQAHFSKTGCIRLKGNAVLDLGFLRADCDRMDLDLSKRIFQLSGNVRIDHSKILARADRAFVSEGLVRLEGNCEATHDMPDGKSIVQAANVLEWQFAISNGPPEKAGAENLGSPIRATRTVSDTKPVRVYPHPVPVGQLDRSKAAPVNELITKLYPLKDTLAQTPHVLLTQIASIGGILPAGGDDAAKSSLMSGGIQQLLIDCMQLTIEPKSWDKSGGSGQIKYFASNKALVITHTEAAHNKINDFLTRLRKRQSLNVMIEIKVVRIGSGDDDKKMNEHVDAALACMAKRGSDVVVDPDAKWLMRTLENDWTSKRVLLAPKILVLDGQGGEMEVAQDAVAGTTFHCKVLPLIGSDRGVINLQTAFGFLRPGETPAEMNSFVLADGEPAVLEIPAPTAPVLGDIPIVKGFYRDATNSSRKIRYIMIVVPRIVPPEKL